MLCKATLLALAACGLDFASAKWLSPQYKNFYSEPLPFPPIKKPKSILTNKHSGKPLHYYEVDIKPFEQQVYPGLKKAKLVGYDGISPGPTFMLEQGTEAIVRFINHGTYNNSVHLHGSYSRAPFDGWAEDTTGVGEYKDYYYPNVQAARTLWYHDHAIDHTAENAYFGQAGFYILHDPQERSLNLPTGDYDVPLALAAKRYNADGTLWDPEANNEETSVYGDVIHVNGQPWPFFNVEPRKYRFRLLDTSISRTFRLYFEDAAVVGTKIPFTVIGSDAGLLEKSVSTSDLYISMAERYEIVFDFAKYAGKNITLRNSVKVGADEDYDGTDRVMQFRVAKSASSTTNNDDVPSALRTVPYPPSKAGVDRTFTFERSGSQWVINGITWKDIDQRIMAKPQRGAIEVWRLENKSGGWSHPIHIHLIDFQVIRRIDGRGAVMPYEAVALKDVVWLGPNEKVEVIARYAPWDGVYMFHCHNLIHEDHEMMGAFNVSLLNDFGYNETTHFIDPMEDRYRAKPIKSGEYKDVETWGSGDFSADDVQAKADWFSGLEAYEYVNEVEDALVSYWSSKTTAPSTTLKTSTVKASSATPAPASTTKSEDKPKTSTSSVKATSSVKTTTTKKRS